MKTHKVVLTTDARDDIKNIKIYIFDTFRYREYANNFSKNIRAAVKILKTGASYTVVVIRVLKDRMYWQATLSRMRSIKEIQI